jgi:Rieske Fe-S protein
MNTSDQNHTQRILIEERKTGRGDGTRRRFLHLCMGGMGTAAVGTVAYPIIGFLGLPRRVGGAPTIKVPVADLTEDQVRYFDREGVQIVVVYTEKTPKVFDAACTHLGCVMTWDPNDHRFLCPCHGAVFDHRGQIVRGPVNEPMRQIDFEIQDGTIVIP